MEDHSVRPFAAIRQYLEAIIVHYKFAEHFRGGALRSRRDEWFDSAAAAGELVFAVASAETDELETDLSCRYRARGQSG